MCVGSLVDVDAHDNYYDDTLELPAADLQKLTFITKFYEICIQGPEHKTKKKKHEFLCNTLEKLPTTLDFFFCMCFVICCKSLGKLKHFSFGCN